MKPGGGGGAPPKKLFLQLAGGETDMAKVPIIWLENQVSQIKSALLKELFRRVSTALVAFFLAPSILKVY